MSIHVEPGVYTLRVKWVTDKDELEVQYTSAVVDDWEQLKKEIEHAKKYVAYNKKEGCAVDVTYAFQQSRYQNLYKDNDYEDSYEDEDLSEFKLDI